MLEKDDRIGDYTLVKFLGRGQFGEVWLAEKQLRVSTRKVRHALKFLSNLGEEVNLKAAEAEVDTWIEAGGHPNVMSVIDMLVAGSHIVIVSEFAEGGSLNGWLKKHGGKAPSEAAALEMMLGILRGVEHLHSRSVVHRDLKPDNILLQGDFPRITDFGISRIVGDGTMSTKAIGSPAYMSPESFAGSKSPPTDIWSAGVILYEMLTARFPYEHETIWGLVNAIQTEAARPLPATISPEARAVVETALRKNVGERFQTAGEMRLAVERTIYNLKGGAGQKHIATERIENLSPTIGQMPTLSSKQAETSEKTFYEGAPTENVLQQTQPAPTENVIRETQASPTAAAIKTDDKEVEKTLGWGEVERRRFEREQAEFVKLSGEIESRAKTAAPKKNPFGLIAGIAGGVIALSLVGVLVWAMSGNSLATANSDSAKNSSANSPAASKNTAPEGMAFVPGG